MIIVRSGTELMMLMLMMTMMLTLVCGLCVGRIDIVVIGQEGRRKEGRE
jgi:hypothetical protein